MNAELDILDEQLAHCNGVDCTCAARENAKKPRGRWMTAIAYELVDVPQHIAFGAVLAIGKPPADDAGMHEWVSKMLRKHGVGLKKMDDFKFGKLSLTGMKVSLEITGTNQRSW